MSTKHLLLEQRGQDVVRLQAERDALRESHARLLAAAKGVLNLAPRMSWPKRNLTQRVFDDLICAIEEAEKGSRP